jgi:formylglycine-generating enzyme required for sulfatase activity
MSISLSRENFNAIQDILLPHMDDQDERRAFVRNALYGCDVLNHIDWKGTKATFTHTLVETLLIYGECERDHHLAIVLLLQHLKSKTGSNHHARIDDLIQACISDSTSDSSTLYYDDEYIWEEVDAEIRALESTRSFELMPQPFDWVEIPEHRVEGFVTPNAYGITDTEELMGIGKFAIAKYPITNAQFKKFIDANGYNEKRWWQWYIADGWETRTKFAWTQPRYWDDEKWNKPNYPVVGVSWYESMAFCSWLSEVTGEKIRLPTDMGWKHAAYGPKDLKYPWGNDWDETFCNNSVSKEKEFGGTSPVQQYEGKGDSPYGVVDMNGNVWEWCAIKRHFRGDLFDVPHYVLHGGSWRNDRISSFTAPSSHSLDPEQRRDWIGFRIARSI